LSAPEQNPQSLTRQRELLCSLSGWQLAALDAMVVVTKSFTISWGLITNKLSIEQAFQAGRLEENWQISQCGRVDGVYGHGMLNYFCNQFVLELQHHIIELNFY
jgi:chaperone required for assembly of F1-ATPase